MEGVFIVLVICKQVDLWKTSHEFDVVEHFVLFIALLVVQL